MEAHFIKKFADERQPGDHMCVSIAQDYCRFFQPGHERWTNGGMSFMCAHCKTDEHKNYNCTCKEAIADADEALLAEKLEEL